MPASNDKLFGYWIDFSHPFLANTASGRAGRSSMLRILRTSSVPAGTDAERQAYMVKLAGKIGISLDELVFGLRLAIREQIIGDGSLTTLVSDSSGVKPGAASDIAE